MMRAGFIAPFFQLRQCCECAGFETSANGAGDAAASISDSGSDISGSCRHPAS
jgi:hypothetical protein